MTQEEIKRIQPIAKAFSECFKRITIFMKNVLSKFNLGDPEFRHNYAMANYSKKKRTRKKYMKKCIK